MRRFFIKIALMAVVAGGALLYFEYDTATNYEETTAKVTGVREVCYMKKKERGAFSKTTTTTKEGPCPMVMALNKSHPEFQDFDLVKVTYIEYRYRSPADGKMHRGKHKQVNRKEGLPLRAGDTGVVHAHKEKPNESRLFRESS